MQLPQDRRIENAQDFWGALLGVIVTSIFIGYAIGYLAR